MDPAQTPIAIVGIGCRFPPVTTGAEGLWAFLQERGDAVREVPADRWRREAFYDPDAAKPGKMYVTRGAYLDQPIEGFDAAFFGVAPVEAAQIDPQQRLVLEVAWEALEDAGFDVWSLRGSRTGVYVGAFTLDNMVTRNEPQARDDIGPQTAMSCTHTVLASRISYVLDLAGPSMAIDTACSSSLVAVHEACRALAMGDCDMALAGGVNRIFRPEPNLMMAKGHFLAPDGRSKSFSANADGYGRGEGAGMVVLRRLNDALAANDRIYAVVDGAGVNQDGRTDGMALPSADSQRELIEWVTRRAGVDPAAVAYVEAHGTGTFVGDPLEMSALGDALGRAPGRRRPLVVGSIKAGIGHQEAAAGVAGLIKAALVVYHRTVPPQAWLDELNPAIDFAGLGLEVAQEPIALGEGPVRVAVNSFGYGGTNAHVLLHSPPSTAPATADARAPEYAKSYLPPVVLVSGHTEGARRDQAAALAQALRAAEGNHAAWGRLVAAAAGRTVHEHRAAVVGDPAAFADVLAQFGSGGQHPDALVGRAPGNRPTGAIFVLSGMGPQWWAMGRVLLNRDGLFRTHAEHCDVIFRELAGWSILDEMRAGKEASRMARTEVAQPASVVLQTGLAAVLAHHGVLPAAVVGHSVGEVAAANISGTLNLEDALTVAFHRSRLQARASGTGGMLATQLPADEAMDLAVAYGPRVSVAAVNGARATTLAGDSAVLAEIERHLATRGEFCRLLRVEVPYHSPAMDPILDDLRSALAGLAPRPSTVPLLSTVDAAYDGGSRWDSDYWVLNVREPVAFHAAAIRLLDEGHRIFLELGAHPVLSLYLSDLVSGARDAAVVPTLHRDRPDDQALQEALIHLWLRGVPVDWQTVVGSERHTPLPPYQWQRERHWQESDAVHRARTGAGPVGGEAMGGLPAAGDPGVRDVELSPTTLPWCREHQVAGAAVLPATGYLEAVLARAAEAEHASGMPLVVEDLHILRPLVLGEHEDPFLRTSCLDDATVTLTGRGRRSGASWVTHATARIGRGRYTRPPALVEPYVEGNLTPVSVEDLYARFAALGIDYQGSYRAVTDLRAGNGAMQAEVDVGTLPKGYTAYPPLLDAALHGLLAAAGPLGEAAIHLPVRLRRAIVAGRVPARVAVRAALRPLPGGGAEADVELRDSDGRPVASLEGLELRPLAAEPGVGSRWLDERCYELSWRSLVAERRTDVPRRWAVLGEGPLANTLTERLGMIGHAAAEAPDLATFGSERLDQVDAVALVVGAGGPEDASGTAADATEVVRRLAARPAGDPKPEFVLVTVGALAVGPDDVAAGWTSAWVAGFRRVAANEVDGVAVRHVDGDGGDPASVATSVIEHAVEELAVRDGALHIPEVVRRTEADRSGTWWDVAPRMAPDESWALMPTQPTLTGMEWVATRRRVPGPGEVELRIEGVGLNHKDVLKQLGVLPTEVAARSFTGVKPGMEQCAIVERVGEGVAGLAPGQRFMAGLPETFRRYVTLPAAEARLVPAPEAWADTETAGQLIALATAHRAVAEIGTINPGEVLLVHGATGAVGLAALQVARRRGARVFATAGTPAKRERLLTLGAEAAFDSRSLDFVREVRAATGGRGADVVINTLPGDGLRGNLEAAAEGGRVIDIGRRQILDGETLPLALFDRNLTYASLDLDQIARDHAQFDALGQRVLARIHAGEYEPVPVTALPASEATTAFSLLARSEHHGKVVVNLADTTDLRCYEAPEPAGPVRSDRSYIISGGTGGVGLQLCRWLAKHGAGRIGLLSRRAYLDPHGREELEALRARGIHIDVAAVDVADQDAVTAFLTDWRASGPPLGGVVHAAGISHDRPALSVTADDLKLVFRPKLLGAAVLDEATVNDPIDLFLVTSSVSSLTGTAGQLSYAAANAALDAFCQWRRRQGRPATCIALGPVADVGMAAADDTIERYVKLLGFEPLPLDVLPDTLDRVLTWNRPVLGVFDIDWSQWTLAEPRAASGTRFTALVEAARSAAGRTPGAVRASLAGLSASDRVDALTKLVADELARILGLKPGDLDTDGSLATLGLDSLMLVEVQTRLNQALDAELSLLGIFGRDSVRDVAVGIEETLRMVEGTELS